jgi:imidazolonepropionase
MLSYGTTSCEAKTGYGLDVESEMKLLQVQKKLQHTHLMDLVSTFLGAHAIPRNQRSNDYMKMVISEMLPKTKGLATFCDVFCEKGVFTVAQAKKILEAGKRYGLLPKIHADEIIHTGGGVLAAEVGAISADHLLTSRRATRSITRSLNFPSPPQYVHRGDMEELWPAASPSYRTGRPSYHQ